MQNNHPKRVEDYTNAALVMGFVNLTWILIVVLATWGFVPALVLAAAVNHLITRLDARRNGSQA